MEGLVTLLLQCYIHCSKKPSITSFHRRRANVSFVNIYGGQFTLSSPLMKPKLRQLLGLL